MALQGALALSRTLHMVCAREGQSGIKRETVGMRLKHTSVIAVKHAKKRTTSPSQTDVIFRYVNFLFAPHFLPLQQMGHNFT